MAPIVSGLMFIHHRNAIIPYDCVPPLPRPTGRRQCATLLRVEESACGNTVTQKSARLHRSLSGTIFIVRRLTFLSYRVYILDKLASVSTIVVTVTIGSGSEPHIMWETDAKCGAPLISIRTQLLHCALLQYFPTENRFKSIF